jgi:hypothetical protein
MSKMQMTFVTAVKNGRPIGIFQAVVRGERYFFAGAIERKREVLQQVGLDAANPELNLTWDDAAAITSAMRLVWPDVECGQTWLQEFKQWLMEIKAWAHYTIAYTIIERWRILFWNGRTNA